MRASPRAAGADPAVQYVRMPPRRRFVWVPLSGKKEAMAGVCLFPASRRRMVAYQYLSWAMVRAFGPKVLPGARATWTPPTSAEDWDALRDVWAAELGAFDNFAVYQRPQPWRSGVGLMLFSEGEQVAFVKLRPNPHSLERERAVLQAFEHANVSTFHTPTALASGGLNQWHWLATAPLPPLPHRPPRVRDLQPLTEDIQATLTPVLARPDTTPPTWRPMHGDLVPWNLRTYGGEVPWLLDWEDVAWGPPDADAVYAAATDRVLYGAAQRPAPRETVEFWLARVGERPAHHYPTSFNAALIEVLRQNPVY